MTLLVACRSVSAQPQDVRRRPQNLTRTEYLQGRVHFVGLRLLKHDRLTRRRRRIEANALSANADEQFRFQRERRGETAITNSVNALRAEEESILRECRNSARTTSRGVKLL